MTLKYSITHNGNTWNSTSNVTSISLSNGSVTSSITTATTRTLNCAGKYMTNNLVIGAKTLNCAGKIMTGNVVIVSQNALIPVTKPTITVSTYTYNGSSQGPAISGYDSNTMTLTGTTSAIKAGGYTISISPKSGYSWTDGSTTAVSKNWTISKATPTITLSKTTMTLSGNEGITGTFTYTVSASETSTVSVKSSSTSLATASISGNTITVTGWDSGSASITVSKAASANYYSCSASCSVTLTIVSPEPVGMLCFTANTAGSTVTLRKTGSPSWTGKYWTAANAKWVTYTAGSTGAITLTNVGDKVYFKGDLTANQDNYDYLRFTMTGSISASGNIMSLCSGNNYSTVKTIPYTYCFRGLFSGCSSLRTAPSLPATTMKNYCYMRMFEYCTSLTTPPALPATTLATDCYYVMFYGCYSLYASDSSSSSASKAWRIPASGTFTNTYQQDTVFQDCLGTRSLNYIPCASGNSYTYYTQNTPV